MNRLLALAAAFFDIQGEVVLQNIVALGKAQVRGGSVDCTGGTFEFNKRAHGGLVQFNQQAVRPGLACAKSKSGTEFLITEPSAHSEPLKDGRQGRGIGDFHLDFFADFVKAIRWMLRIRSRRSRDGPLESQNDSRFWPGLPGVSTAVWRLGANSKELAVLREPPLRRVEYDVFIASSALTVADRLRAELRQKALKRFHV